MKKIVAVVLSLLMMFAFFGCSKKEEPQPTTTTTTTTTTTKPAATTNPFTGEDGYSKSAIGKRPVAIVVENLKPARPQWGIETPDIICEGEVEGGISRMLWLYANMNKVPEKVGPIRSARPSYVQFSTFFNAIFIHWGGSHSKAGYTGGYETIRKLGVDDIDGMKGGKLFGRDSTRSVSSEHRGILHGKNVSSVIKSKNIETKMDPASITQFTFNDEIKDAGTKEAKKVGVTFSDRTSTRDFAYGSDNKYHTQDWRDDVKFQNLIILSAQSEYITVPYKGSKTTYLNYKWTSGKGYYISNGKATEIAWSIDNKKLVLKDSAGKPVSLNKGRSYIGFISSNHSGNVTMS